MACPSFSCPNCGAPIDTGEPVPLYQMGPGRGRVVRLVLCACFATVRLATYEGWERWYPIHWWLGGDLEEENGADVAVLRSQATDFSRREQDHLVNQLIERAGR